MAVLSVNVNKVAVLRNSRGGRLPDPVEAARVAIAAGCGGITVHPRPDARHVRADDVERIAALLAAHSGVEFNIEGNPFAPPRSGYPGLMALVQRARPAQVTLVPDSDGQLTSDHGWSIRPNVSRLRRLIDELHALGCRVSLFMDIASPEMEAAAAVGADRIELYTGPYAEQFAAGDIDAALDGCRIAAERARAAGLGINAGHDLDQRNLGPLLRAVPDIAEVSIGHALFGEALYAGLAATVAAYLDLIQRAPTAAPIHA